MTAIWIFLSQIPIALFALVAKLPCHKVLAFACLIRIYSCCCINSTTDIADLKEKICQNENSITLNIQQLAKRKIEEFRVSEVDCLATSTNVIVFILSKFP